MEVRNNKLQAKDLINVGIFTAIYFVVFFAGMMLGYIPIFIPLLGLVCPILCGIPFMLYLTKVKKFGMVSLTGIILGLLNVLICLLYTSLARNIKCGGAWIWPPPHFM